MPLLDEVKFAKASFIYVIQKSAHNYGECASDDPCIHF